MAVEVTAPESTVPPGASVKALLVGQALFAGSDVVIPSVEIEPEYPTSTKVFAAHATSTELRVMLDMVKRVDAVW